MEVWWVVKLFQIERFYLTADFRKTNKIVVAKYLFLYTNPRSEGRYNSNYESEFFFENSLALLIM